jgi:Icc-related predicted phosphoesterase
MNDYRFFYTSDLHGSDLCFTKAIDATVHHKASALLIGGDLAGKSLTKIIRKPGGYYEGFVAGKKERARSGTELEEMKEAIANSGSYSLILSEEEFECTVRDKDWHDQQILSLITKRLAQWLWLAEMKLKPHGIRLVIICGNDDPWSLDRVVRHSTFAEDPQHQTVILGENHEVLGESAGNLPSPFTCPRDMDEERLEKRIREKLANIKDIGRAIFMLHIPPYNSTLDLAYELDRELRVKTEGSSFLQQPVGSKAVRTIIEEAQPLIALHGHIHESPGYAQIGRTLCFNPGSDHHHGLMRGFLITLDRDQIKAHATITL